MIHFWLKGNSDRGGGASVAESNSNSSPYRQILPSTYDFEPLSACPEENVLELEEPENTSGEKLGRIQFSVSYDFDAMTLTVKIMKAEELAAKDLSGTSDPYVKICLLPDKKHTLTTNIKRKNLNPRWNEVFAFEGKTVYYDQSRMIRNKERDRQTDRQTGTGTPRETEGNRERNREKQREKQKERYRERNIP